MPKSYRWRNRDLEALTQIRKLWPELVIEPGARNAVATFTSLKGLSRFLRFVAAGPDEDLPLRMLPLPPSTPNTNPPHWWYTITTDGPPWDVQARVSIPPADLRIIAALLEAK